MSEVKTKTAETPDALHQRRRRQRLLELKASTVDVLLTEEQGQRLETLLTAGYAPDKSSVLAKSLDARPSRGFVKYVDLMPYERGLLDDVDTPVVHAVFSIQRVGRDPCFFAKIRLTSRATIVRLLE